MNDPQGKSTPDLGYAPNAERAVLASILADRDVIPIIAEMLKPAHFMNAANREIYRAMLACFERREAPDFLNVDAQLALTGSRDADVSDLARLTAFEPYEGAGLESWSPVHAESYANTVLRAHKIRIISGSLNTVLTELARDPDLDPAESMQTILAELESVQPSREGPMPFERVMPFLLEVIDEERAGRVERKTIPTGIRPLDDMTYGGLRLGELAILGARPSVGKTALAEQIALNAGTVGPVLFFSLEMDVDSVTRRMLACASEVPHEAIHRSILTPRQRDMIGYQAERLAALPISIDDQGGLSVAQIRSRCRRQAAQGGLDLVIVDYLELVHDPNPNTERQLANISQGLKELAKELKCAVLLLSQLSREVEAHAPFIPQLKHLRYSGSIEAIADKVIFLYREDYYVGRGMIKLADRHPHLEGMASVILAKHRNGDTGTINLRWRPEILRFEVPGGRPQFEEAQQTIAVAD